MLSLAEKKQRSIETGGTDPADTAASCARTDAKTQNRDIQMKYDIAKNEDGPLRKTVKRDHETVKEEDASISKEKTSNEVTADRHPGLDERLRNIETHVAVRYGKEPPYLLPCLALNLDSSTFTAAIPSRSSEVFGRAPYSARERLSTMGGLALQPAPSRRKRRSRHPIISGADDILVASSASPYPHYCPFTSHSDRTKRDAAKYLWSRHDSRWQRAWPVQKQREG